MKYRTSAFYPDELYLSKWDLIKLFFGYTFQVDAYAVNKVRQAYKNIEETWEDVRARCS